MFCTNCGKELPKDSKFCLECGTAVPCFNATVSDTLKQAAPQQVESQTSNESVNYVSIQESSSNQKSSRKSTSLLVVVVLVIVAVVGFLKINSSDKENRVLPYDEYVLVDNMASYLTLLFQDNKVSMNVNGDNIECEYILKMDADTLYIDIHQREQDPWWKSIFQTTKSTKTTTYFEATMVSNGDGSFVSIENGGYYGANGPYFLIPTDISSNEMSSNNSNESVLNINDSNMGSGNSSSSDTANARDAYNNILGGYYIALADKYDSSTLESYGMNYLCSYHDISEIGYYIGDVDGNGISELLIGEIGEFGGESGFFFDLYTLVDGCPSLIVASSERDRYYLCEDGLIANEGSFDAWSSFYSYYELGYSDASLLPKEAIIYDDSYGDCGPWFYTESDVQSATIYNGMQVEISEDVAMQTIEKHPYANISFIPIPAV